MNDKITYENGKFVVYGKELSMKDGMYCLSELFDIMNERGMRRLSYGLYIRKKSFLRLVECVTGIKVESRNNAYSNLRDSGLIKYVGARKGRKLYATLPIMWCILTDYNDALTKDAADCLILKREFNSVG